MSNALAPMGHNVRKTRDEWIDSLLNEPKVTRVAHHIALVLCQKVDTETGKVACSIRDLETITGWSRTAIIDHLSELEVYFRCTFGRGRAKTIFEMIGVIKEAREEILTGPIAPSLRSEAVKTTADRYLPRSPGSAVVASQPDTKPETRCVNPSRNNVHEVSQPDTKTLFNGERPSPNPVCVMLAGHKNDVQNGCGQPDGHKNDVHGVEVRQPDTTDLSLKSKSKSKNHDAGASADEVPLRDKPIVGRLNEDGSFTGLVFEMSAAEYGWVVRTYRNLTFPAAMIEADAMAATWFGREKAAGQVHTNLEKAGRLNKWLKACDAKAAEKASESVQEPQLPGLAPSPPPTKPTPSGRQFWAAAMRVPGGAGADLHERAKWIDGKIVLRDDERAEWLPKFSNEPERLDMVLLEAAASVQPESGKPLVAAVRGFLARRHREAKDSDERYLKATRERAAHAGNRPNGRYVTQPKPQIPSSADDYDEIRRREYAAKLAKNAAGGAPNGIR